MNCPTCGHPAADHSNLAGCTVTRCACTTKRRDLQVAADTADTAHALDRVERGTDPRWLAAATAAVAHLAQQRTPFTSDDVWDRLHDVGAPDVREPRALGPVMKRALQGGAIRVEGFASSRRRHGTPIRSYVGTAQ